MFDFLKSLLKTNSPGSGSAANAPEIPSPNELAEGLKPPEKKSDHKDRPVSKLDHAQDIADIGGLFDQSGVTDLANSAVSAMRAFMSKDKDERREHVKDAGIRLLSAVPVFGDLAKLGRTGKYVKEAGSAVRQTRQTQLGTRLGGLFGTGKAATSQATRDGGKQPETQKPPSFMQRIGGMLPAPVQNMLGMPQKEDPDRTYFFASEEDRLRQRMDPKSKFFNEQEFADRQRLATGKGSKQLRTRVNKINNREMMHQEFLKDPDTDTTGMQRGTKKQKEEFDQQRKKYDDEELSKEGGNVLEVFKKLGGAVVTRSIAGFVTGLLTLPLAISKFGEAMVEARRSIGIYDGGTAGALASTDVQRRNLDIETARDTSGSTRAFLAEMQSFREAYQPMREDMTNVVNVLGTMAVGVGKLAAMVYNGVTTLFGIRTMMDFLNDWLKHKDKANSNDPPRELIDALMKNAGQNFNPAAQRARIKPLDPIK